MAKTKLFTFCIYLMEPPPPQGKARVENGVSGCYMDAVLKLVAPGAQRVTDLD